MEEDVVDEVEGCLEKGSGRSEEKVSTMAVRTPCRWVNERAFGHREEHRERDLGDEVEDPQEEREELDKRRTLRGVLGGMDDGELDVVEDVHKNEAELGFEPRAAVMNSRRSAA